MTGPPIERGPWTGDLGQWINPQTGITVSAGDDTVLQVTGVTFVNGTLTGNARDLQVTISGGGGGLPPGGFLEQPLVNDGTSGGGEWSNTISSRSAPPDAPPTNGAALALYGESGLNDDDVIGYGGSISVGGGTGDSGDGAYGGNSIVEGGAAGTYGGGIVGGYGANSDSGGGAARMFGGYGGPDASAAEINVGGASPFSPASIQITAGGTYTQGGNVTVAGGVGTTDPGGNVYFSGGASTSGDGGNSEFLGGASTSGIGGEAVMQSGAGSVAGNVSIYAASGTISNGDINITLNNTVLGTAGKLNVSGLPAAVAGLPTNALWVDPSTGCVVAAPGTGPGSGGGAAIQPETGSSIKISAFPAASLPMGADDFLTGLQDGVNVNFSQAQVLSGRYATASSAAPLLSMRAGGGFGSAYGGGNVTIESGYSYGSLTGGELMLLGGGSEAGIGGNVKIVAGGYGNAEGGNVKIYGGYGGATGNGGNLYLYAGAATGSGVNGFVFLRNVPIVATDAGLPTGAVWINSSTRIVSVAP